MKQFNKGLRITMPLAMFAGLVIATGSAGAATIAHVGNDIDWGADFTDLSGSVGDLDGDGIVGTDGFYFPGTDSGNVLSAASYITNFSATTSNVSLNFYPNFVDPNGVTRRAGTTNPNPANVLFSFEFTSDVPTTVGLSIFLDAIDVSGWSADQVTINVTGDSITYNSPSDNGDNPGGQLAAFADLLHFQITGAEAGDVVQVFSIAAENGSQATVQGFALESIPEPSSSALLALGGLALIFRRRK